jgi:hypothetical protein
VRSLGIAVVLAFALPTVCIAQVLQRVSVQSFALSADTTQPHTGTRFTLYVSLRVPQRINEIDNLQLPDLAPLEVLGDFRQVSSAPGGSLYREAVTVEAHNGGTITIGPATFDAVDAKDGKAKQWSTNSLVLHVTGPPRTFNFSLVAGRVMIAAGVAIVIFGILMLPGLYRPRVAAQATAPVAPPPPVRIVSSQEWMRESLALLRGNPTRAGAMRARAVLHRMVGATDGETLDDVMQQAERSHPDIVPVLPAIERAAFTYESDVSSAVQAAIATLERVLAGSNRG